MSEHLLFCCDLAHRDPVGKSIKRVTGWCLGTSPISALYLHVSDNQFDQLPVGFARPDVAQVYPNYPGAENAGFRLTLASPGFSGIETNLLVKTDDRFHRVPVYLETRAIQRLELSDATRSSQNISRASSSI
jgi:hypothetical protein